jgi:hypothetical protein
MFSSFDMTPEDEILGTERFIMLFLFEMARHRILS